MTTMVSHSEEPDCDHRMRPNGKVICDCFISALVAVLTSEGHEAPDDIATIVHDVDNSLAAQRTYEPPAQPHRCSDGDCTTENCKMRREWVERLSDGDSSREPYDGVAALDGMIDEPEFEPLSMPSGCSAFFIESVPGETWAVTTACAEHKYLEGQPFTREPGPIHPCRSGCVYERPDGSPDPSPDMWHLAISPGVTRCRADYPNLCMTDVRAKVTCGFCIGHSWRCSTHGARGDGYTSLSLAMDDADAHIERLKTANGLCSIRTYSGDEPSVPSRRDPGCPYCVLLHPDERCTCVPSVNAPVLSVEQPHYVMYNSLGAEIGCVVGERSKDAELRLQPAGTRFQKTAREACARHPFKPSAPVDASDMSDDMPEVARIAAFEIHHDRLMREIAQLKKDRDFWRSEASRLWKSAYSNRMVE